MIEKPTVLILGAGSSVDYGFPTGPDLRDIICAMPRNQNQHSTFYSILKYSDKIQQFELFCEKLKGSGTRSVDAFLERDDRDEFQWIGRVAIAAALFPLEDVGRLFEKSSSWYHYLFAQMSASFDDFGRNRVSVLTYNYDRSLEFFLLHSMTNLYGRPESECADLLKHIPIVHMHGTLGDLPFLGEQKKAYDGAVDSRALSLAAKMIRVVHEVRNEPQFAKAKRLLADAHTVCFLGFGYHHANLDRLSPLPTKPRYFGMAFDMVKAERQLVSKYFPNEITFGKKKEDVATFLREHGVLMQDPAPWLAKEESEKKAAAAIEEKFPTPKTSMQKDIEDFARSLDRHEGTPGKLDGDKRV
ncbi:MAG: hypothetical protein JXB04_13490 [Kiritimatiellae bacterium]|nr:hypothetical protein [Kiritimatiellia bacterium]